MWLVAAVAVILTLVLQANHRQAVAQPRQGLMCSAGGLSSNFAEDGTAFCALPIHIGSLSTAFWRTTDGGKTWTRAAARGLPGAVHVEQLIVSPNYAIDHSVYLRLGIFGFFRSTDDGETWEDDPFGRVWGAASDVVTLWPPQPWPVVAPFLLHPPSGGDPVAAFAVTNPKIRSGVTADVAPFMLVDPLSPARIPVVGSAHGDLMFLIPDDLEEEGTGFSISQVAEPAPDGEVHTRLILSACNAALVCAEELHVFRLDEQLVGASLAPDFNSSHAILVFTRNSDTDAVRAWQSTDSGKKFESWKSVNRLLKGTHQAKVGLALSPQFPRRFVLRISQAAQFPEEQIFRSNNAGDTWRRVAFGLGSIPPFAYSKRVQRSATIPWASQESFDPANIHMGSDGTLFVFARLLGDHLNTVYQGVFCSTDGGRTWKESCKRKGRS